MAIFDLYLGGPRRDTRGERVYLEFEARESRGNHARFLQMRVAQDGFGSRSLVNEDEGAR